MIDGGRIDAGLLERRGQRLRHDFQVTFVADPAFFPVIVEILALTAIVIDEIGRQLGAAEILGHASAFADLQRGGRVAIEQFVRRRGFRPALFRRCVEDIAIAAGNQLQRINQTGGPGPLGGRHVHSAHVVAIVQRGGDDAGVLPIGEG